MILSQEFLSVYLNLLKSVIGTGLLAYPYYISEFGIFPLVFISTIACIFSSCGLIFYAYCNKKIGKKSTMSSIADHILPIMRPLVGFSISLKCFLVSVLYFKILKGLLESQYNFISNYITDTGNIKKYLFSIIFLLSTPLSFTEKITKLKISSFIGIAAILIVMISNTYTFLQNKDKIDLKFTGKRSIYFTRIGDIVYGFTCHQNIFSVQNEMKNKSLLFLSLIIISTMTSAFIIYMYFGIINYKMFGQGVDATVLINYGKMETFQSFVVIMLFSFMLLITIPLQVHPCRTYALNLISDNLVDSKKARYVSTFVILLGIYLFGNYDILNIKKIYIYVGGGVSSFICFIFGSIYCLKLKAGRSVMGITAISTLLFGIYVICGFLYWCINEIFTN